MKILNFIKQELLSNKIRLLARPKSSPILRKRVDNLNKALELLDSIEIMEASL